MTSWANLDTDSAIRVSVSDMWDIGVGGIEEMSTTSANCRGHVDDNGRTLHTSDQKRVPSNGMQCQ